MLCAFNLPSFYMKIAVSLIFRHQKFHTEYAQALQQLFGDQGNQGGSEISWSEGSNLKFITGWGSADLAHFPFKEKIIWAWPGIQFSFSFLTYSHTTHKIQMKSGTGIIWLFVLTFFFNIRFESFDQVIVFVHSYE